MEINGKVYRNLEGQVEYLTDKYGDLQDQINDVKGKLTHYIIVEELPVDPEDIDTSAVYLVGPKGTEPDTYYEEWVYVETSDGTWTWEKLGDTDSVDLSGYLEKNTTTTTEDQAYIKNADGTQGMMNITLGASGYTVAKRYSDGTLAVGYATADNRATNKGYCDDNYVAKQKGTTSYNQLYAKASDGSQYMVNASTGNVEGNIPVRSTGGNIFVPTSPTDYNHAACKGWIETYFLQKQYGTTSYSQVYTKNADGTQGMANIVNGAATAYSVAQRDANGQITVAETPTANGHAASKAYVDAAVGQLLYLHDLEIIITVDATNKLYVKAYLVNGSSTAITSFDRQLYRRIDVQWGAFGPDMANVEPVAVSKLPDTFRQDEFDEPFIGFLYQYISGGNLISGKTDSNMSSTITDTVISW